MRGVEHSQVLEHLQGARAYLDFYRANIATLRALQQAALPAGPSEKDVLDPPPRFVYRGLTGKDY